MQERHRNIIINSHNRTLQARNIYTQRMQFNRQLGARPRTISAWKCYILMCNRALPDYYMPSALDLPSCQTIYTIAIASDLTSNLMVQHKLL